jgi:methylmalonyl-CoA/ethylmalonyl-CoA epimerase
MKLEAAMTAPAQTTTNIQLDGIAQIALTVTDLPRAKAFYKDILGLTFLFDAGSMAFFRCGTIRLMLGLAEQPVAPAGTILYYKVVDIQSTHVALTEQGVAFLQPPHLVAKMPDHDLWMAFLKDPDGNVLGLMSEVPRSS